MSLPAIPRPRARSGSATLTAVMSRMTISWAAQRTSSTCLRRRMGVEWRVTIGGGAQRPGRPGLGPRWGGGGGLGMPPPPRRSGDSTSGQHPEIVGTLISTIADSFVGRLDELRRIDDALDTLASGK